MRRYLSRLTLIFLCSVCVRSVASGATITVTSLEDSGPGTLRQAIKDAAAGDTINFSTPPNRIINLTSGELLIDKSLTIAGPTTSILRIQNDNIPANFRVFEIAQPAVSVTISDLDIFEGSAVRGGGIYCENVALTIANCVISFNSASDQGGGIYFAGEASLTVTNTTINGNSTTNSSSYGGGLALFPDTSAGNQTITIINSTISGNEAGSGGGAVYVPSVPNDYTVTFTMTNTTIASNKAKTGNGGGIYNNTGIGIGIIYAENSIIAGNIIPAGNMGTEFYGTLGSQGYNLIGKQDNGATITGTTTGNQLNVDPKLDILRYNGSRTLTHALLSGSPAIDAGNSGGVIFDQRGLARPVDSPTSPNPSGGDGSDVGAYEVQADQLPGCNTINSVVNTNADSGSGSLRDVIANVCNGTTVTFGQGVRGTIDLTSGELAIDKSLTIDGPGANLLSVQRSAADGTPEFRIFNVSSSVSAAISGLTITNGKVSGLTFGGGILNAGALSLSASTIFNNSAGFSGGGICNNGTLNLNNSTVASNAAGSGGGGGISGYGSTNISNSTIFGNTTAGNAGGIAAGNVTISNSTVTGNDSSGSGGGIFNNGSNGASVRVRSTIVALNTAASAPDVSGAIVSENFNLFGDNSGASISPTQFGDLIGTAASPVDPRLGAFQDNGGPTPTLALLAGSPAIDHASSVGLTGSVTTDQRGFNRTVDLSAIPNASDGDGTDIGAFELPDRSASPTPTPTAIPSSLGNISTRLAVEGGDNVLIGGFIVTGTQDKKVLIRAIGPSLPVSGALADPLLELHDKDGALIVSDDDWKETQEAAIEATGIPPSNELESAIVASLPANNAAYTAVVRGANGGSGVGLVEIYDLDRSVDSKLANISTRGLVQSGDNVMIGGFIVLGDGSQKVIMRAIGPSLPVEARLADPLLELHDQNGDLLQSNDDWKTDEKAEVEASGVPPTDDAESAIVRTLPSGNYTAIVRGVNNATGVGLVEVYALD